MNNRRSINVRLRRAVCAAAAVFTMSAAVTASAEITGCTVNSATDEVTVTGTAEPGAELLLTVMRGGGAALDNIGYQYQKKCGADGTFSFTFKLDEADIYKVYASTPDTTYTYDFVFSNSGSAREIIESINAASSAGAVANILKSNRYAAGLFVAECDAEPHYSYIAGLICKNIPYDAADTDGALKEFRQYMIYGYAINGDIDNIFDLDAYLDIYGIDGAGIFTSDIFKESHQKETTRRLKGKSVSSRTEFEELITEQMSLALIKDPDGYGNIQKVCETFASRIGINTAGTSAAVYRGLYGKNLSNFAALKTEFNRLKDESASNSGSGGSGGGGGGGGGASLGHTSGGTSSGGAGISMNTNGVPERLPMDTAEPEIFGDIAGYDWAKEAIETLFEKGIVSGRAEGVFAPAENITRSEFVKLVVMAFGITDSGGRVPFSDTNEDSWDYEYIKAAYNAGIINGISASEFGCGLPVTRQDMAVMVQRAAGIADVDTDAAEKFADDWQIKNYAYNAAYALKSRGIMVGDENNMFRPKSTATRAEAAKVICAAM